ncbi:hypothetical protein QN277_003843 [Acacia crassicarpa]|uniref:Ubiquitin-like domain-containing protein n=1 Tax=Acacia crassicarpa TaxID=499986 RepID=A0AAE1MG09_9FABA|nr:hypothetical protein QN277_003843 [Acacia crassicarpa]
MADSKEELEPLFDYRRVQPHNLVCIEDDDDEVVVCVDKKRKTCQPVVNGKNEEQAVVVDIEDKEDDWLPPPPKVLRDESKSIAEDSTLKELRLKKQELVSFAQSTKNMLQEVEESAKRELDDSLQTPVDAAKEIISKPPERDKIVISIQDKDGVKHFRVYMDDKFERIFKMYSDKIKLDQRNLVFSFDGDKVNPSQTPGGLGMEDDDIIEVHVKSS